MEWVIGGAALSVLLVCVLRPQWVAKVKAKIRSLVSKGGDGGEE